MKTNSHTLSSELTMNWCLEFLWPLSLQTCKLWQIAIYQINIKSIVSFIYCPESTRPQNAFTGLNQLNSCLIIIIRNCPIILAIRFEHGTHADGGNEQFAFSGSNIIIYIYLFIYSFN